MFFKGWWTALAPHAEGTETWEGLVYCRMMEGRTSTLRVRSAQQKILLKSSTLRTVTGVPKSMASHGAGSPSVWQRSTAGAEPTSGPPVSPSMHLAARKLSSLLHVEDMVAVTGFSSGSVLKGSWPTWVVSLCGNLQVEYSSIHTQYTWCHENTPHKC